MPLPLSTSPRLPAGQAGPAPLAHLSAAVIRLIPPADVPRLARESSGAQAEVAHWLPLCQRIADAPRGGRGRVVDAIAAEQGLSAPTVRRRYDYYRSGNPRTGETGVFALIDRSRHPHPDSRSTLPVPFQHWVRGLFAPYQRSQGGRQVRRYLLDRLARWRATLSADDAIPGYSSPPADGPEGHPPGWSYSSLLRLRGRRRIAAVLSSQGPKAGAALLPSNYTTRAGLRFGQRVFFDDQEYDVKVNYHGNSKAMRPKGFNALEHLSGSFELFTAIPTLWDREADTVRHLRLVDFTWFAISYLLLRGYRTDDVGTSLVFEHGTATGFNNQDLETPHGFHDFDAAVNHVTGGRVSVVRSGRFDSPLFADMLFRPQSTGNFRFKAPLESMFNLVRNHMAALPGPTGRNRDMAPEESYGLDLYNTRLLKLYEQLPPSRRELLEFPYLNWPEFVAMLSELYPLINDRTDHALEAWRDLGFYAPCFTLDPHASLSDPSAWRPRDDLLRIEDPERRRAVEALARWHPFPLSPSAVARSLRSQLTPLRDELVPFLLPTQWAYPVKVRPNHEIHLSDPKLFPGHKDIFLARLPTGPDTHETLDAGTRCLVYWHPIVDRAWLCNAAGGYRGVIHRFQPPTAGDVPSIVRNQGKINALASSLREDTVRDLVGIAEARQQMRRHNDRILDPDKPATPEDKKAHRRTSRAQSRLSKPSSSSSHDISIL